MNTETTKENIKGEVLKKIISGEVAMKPKYYFVLKLCLLVLLVALVFLSSIFLLSYIIFNVRIGGEVFLLGFGKQGLYHFIVAFPWIMLILTTILLLTLDWLLKSFRFGYESPILYLFLFTLVIMTLLGSVINFTSFHKGLMQQAERSKLPFGGGFYDGLRKSHEDRGIFRGEVMSVEEKGFNMKHRDEHIIRVITPLNMNLSVLNEGDNVFVAGELINGEIRAYGVRKLAEGE